MKRILTLLLFIGMITIAIILYLIFKVPYLESKVLLMLLLLLILFGFWISWCGGKKQGEEEPQELDEAIEYRFIAYDEKTKIAFLGLHIREEVEVPPLNSTGSLPLMFSINLDQTITEVFEEDITGVFKIDFFDPNISPGDTVKKVKRNTQVGIEKVA